MVADARSIEKKESFRPSDPGIDRDFRGSWSGFERDCMFHNPDGPAAKFYNCGYVYGLDFDDDGRDAVPADVDGDGDLDLVLMSLQGLRLMENTSPPRGFARVRLEAAKTERLALGTIVRVTAGGVTQQDYVRISDGFMTQVPRDVHFGLGAATAIEKLEIVWPSKETQVFTNLPAGKLLAIREGSDPEVRDIPRWPELKRAKPAFSADLAADRLEGGAGPIAEKGRPAVVNFWAPWCAPCKEELPGIVKAAAAFGGEARFAGVSVETEKKDDVKAAVASFGMTYPQFLANDAVMKSFFGADGKAVLPSTFVFDGSGRLRRVFQRPVAAGELEALLAALRDEGIAAADLERRGSRLVEQGRFEEGVEWLKKAAAQAPGNAIVHYHLGIAYWNLGRDGDALASWTRAVELEPEYARARVNLGEVLRKIGRPAEAVTHYQAALKIRGEDANTLYALADAAASAGMYPAAMDAFDRSLKADPRQAAVWKAKAQLHRILKQPEEERKALEKALELEPGDAASRARVRDLK